MIASLEMKSGRPAFRKLSDKQFQILRELEEEVNNIVSILSLKVPAVSSKDIIPFLKSAFSDIISAHF